MLLLFIKPKYLKDLNVKDPKKLIEFLNLQKYTLPPRG